MNRAPRAVRGAGFIVPFVGAMTPVLMDDAGQELTPPAIPLDELVAAAPFRSVLTKRWPTQIAHVWVLADPEPLPLRAAAMDEIAAVLEAGHGVLLLSPERERRDRVRAALLALFGGEAVQ